MMDYILVGIGGFAGSVLRYLIGKIPITEHTAFPTNTLIINILGAFLMGLIIVKIPNEDNITLLLKIGLCGGFTTFSTFSYELVELLKSGSYTLATIYMTLSLIGSMAMIIIPQLIIN